MSAESALVEKLRTLNHIAETLNQAADVRSVLDDTLARLVQLMGLRAGWIFLKDPAAQAPGADDDYVLAAHYNLPPALALDPPVAWQGGCACQELCNEGRLTQAYNEVECSRLVRVPGDRQGLAVHASTALRSAERVLGILNVAGPDWDAFRPEALALLSNVGSQVGVALERARLYDMVQERRIGEQAALLDFSNQLLSRLGLDDLLDYLVEAVRRMLAADACALLLPGERPDWLDVRAASGWRVDPVAHGRQAPADGQSGPGQVMRTRRPLVREISEQRQTSSWAPDWLLAEGFCSQAVAPLIVEGRSVGVLTVDARRPREFDDDDVRLLQLMSNQAAIAVEKMRLHDEELKGRALEREMALGQQIQRSLLPTCCPEMERWDLAVHYQPARLVGGDFYDLFELPGAPGRLGFVIADVAGKGVPAALFMALSRTILRTIALGGRGPAATLERANEMILNDSWAELFLTAFYGVLDLESGRLVYANAGHNRPLWLHAATGEVEELAARGIALAAMGPIEVEECVIDLAPGDGLLLYTDGVSEAMNSQRQPFGEERVRALLARNGFGYAQEILDEVVRAVTAFAGNGSQEDDITLVAIRRRSLRA